LLAAALGYFLLTCWMLWPLPAQAGSAVQDLGDPVFEIWVMRWVQHQLVTDPLDLYQANAFYPFESSLAYSEEGISTALLAAPVYLATGNDVLAYNFVLLSSFWLVGFAIFLLCRELGAAPGAAFVAGVVAAFAPARYGQLSHLHMLVLGWLPLALWLLARYVHTRRRVYLLGFSVAWAVQLLASLHLAVFATLALALLAPPLLWFEARDRDWLRREAMPLALAIIVPYLLLAPTLLPHLQVGETYGFERTREEVKGYAATPRNFISVYVRNHVWRRALPGQTEPLFPGGVALAGTALSALAWRTMRGRRWLIVAAGGLTLVAGVLALGFGVSVSGRRVPLPYAAIYELLPPMRNVRGIGRFGLLTAIGLPILTASGYSALWQRIAARRPRRAVVTGWVLTLALTLVAAVELRSGVGAVEVPNDARAMAVYDWLADQPSGPVLELPAAGLHYDILEPIAFMYGSTRHWHPVVAGYSGYIPRAHYELVAAFGDTRGTASAVNDTNVGLLHDLGVRWVVIHHRDSYDWHAAVTQADRLPDLRQVGDIGDSTVYEVLPAAARAEPSYTVELPDMATVGVGAFITLRSSNPNPNQALGWLTDHPEARVTWRDGRGRVVKRDMVELPLPALPPAGEMTYPSPIAPPEEPGVYELEVDPPVEVAIPTTRAAVTVHATPSWEEPPVALVAFEDVPDEAVRPGDVLLISVTWEVAAALARDCAATLQLLDPSGERRAAADLLPDRIDPPTSAWQPGDRVTLQFDLHLPPDLPPGEYRLLTALYSWQPSYPRIPVTLPDGSRATEALAGPVMVVP
jgi:hypothetical protein